MKYKKWQTPEMMSAIFILHRAILVSSDMRYAASGGSQPRKEEGASHHARRGKNAEAFLNKAPSIIFHDRAGPPMRQDTRSHHLTVTLQ